MSTRGSARALIALVAAVLVLPVTPVSAQSPPQGDISRNVRFVTNIPEMEWAIALNFIGDTMFVSTELGLYSYDVSDPAAPALLGALPMYLWENEDMDVDRKRELVFISRDPRVIGGLPSSLGPSGAVHIIDVSDPARMVPAGSFELPAGHTTTCVNDCDFLWTGGPLANPVRHPGWSGRPIYATDVTNPLTPVPCPEPIDTGRDNGATAYAHDVQVDANGVAWVSGEGGVRGYWTSGKHRNPLTGKVEEATGCDPIPYAGGGTPESATPSRFMHNSWRDVDAAVDGRKGDVLYATEEELSSACAQSGRFVTYDLQGSYNGEGWRNIDKTKFTMTALDTWTPEGQAGTTGCDSAHYLSDRGDGVIAIAFYDQGTRFLDVSDPRDIRQIGFFRPDDATAWAPYFYRGYVFVADNARGIDVLKFQGSSGGRTTRAPFVASRVGFEMDPKAGYLCPLPPSR